jgi:hypothetical protein
MEMDIHQIPPPKKANNNNGRQTGNRGKRNPPLPTLFAFSLADSDFAFLPPSTAAAVEYLNGGLRSGTFSRAWN